MAKRGRPRVDGDCRRRRTVTISLPASVLDALDRQAEQEGLPISAVIRSKIQTAQLVEQMIASGIAWLPRDPVDIPRPPAGFV